MPSQHTSEQQNQPAIRQRGGLMRREPFGFGMMPGEFFRLNPFSMMRRMSEEMDRLFGESGGRRGEGTWSPAIEVFERDGNYTIRAEVPGIKPEDVRVEISDDAIVLQGERRSEQEENREGMHVQEVHYGQFYRTIPLPEGAKTEEARASVNNGVLEITVPTEEQKSRRRQVPIEGSQAGQSTQTQAKRETGKEVKEGTTKVA